MFMMVTSFGCTKIINDINEIVVIWQATASAHKVIVFANRQWDALVLDTID